MEQDIKKLQARVDELEKYVADRKRQQIVYPIDKESLEVLSRYVMRITGSYVYEGGAAARPFLVYEGIQGSSRFEVGPASFEYVADPSSDTIRILHPATNNVFANDMTVSLLSTDTPPGGLSALGLTTYYVVSAASNGYTFKLSATLGGAAIDITSAGNGRQFIYSF